jgi:hypothetical protein
MTREEAIKILKAIRAYECYPKSASEETKVAIDMAIEALADRPTGEWIEEDEYGDLWVCDQCGFASEFNYHFCPNCGAKMRGENDDDL